jgi:hypothetical protein
MDPLTAEEIIGAATILLDGGGRPGAIFQAIDLRERPRTPFSHFPPAPARHAGRPCSSGRTGRASGAS